MNELTPEKLAELRRMLDAATPRPWMACEDEDEVLIVLDDDSNHWPGRDALAAKLDEVREWIDRRGVNVDDRDDDYMRGYRDAQRHARLDANELRVLLDATTLSAPCEVLDD